MLPGAARRRNATVAASGTSGHAGSDVIASDRLRDFQVLSFDCYGTLIDWETGIARALLPLVRAASIAPPLDEMLARFGHHESQLEAAYPRMPYPQILAAVYERIAGGYGIEATAADCARFGASVGEWPAFPDSAPALAYLKRHFKLLILSNVDRRSFARTNKRLGVAFDAVYTAEEIGSYKPRLANFRYMLDRLARRGYKQHRILHVAQSLYHDHVPAQALGLRTAWIDRRHGGAGSGATPSPLAGALYDFRFANMAAFAAAHRTGLCP